MSQNGGKKITGRNTNKSVRLSIKLIVLILSVLLGLAATRKLDSVLISGDIQDFFVQDKYEKFFTQTELYAGLKEFSVDGNIITSTSDDPWIFLGTADVKPFKYIKIDIHSNLSTELEAQFFYMTPGKDFSEDDSKKAILKNGINYIRIPRANYSAIRLDLVSQPGFPLQVNSVELTNRFIPSLSGIMLLALPNIILWTICFVLLFKFELIISLYNNIMKKQLLTISLLILFISIFIYWDFISTGLSILFSVSDAYAQTWPYMVNVSDYIRQEGFPMWSFSIGLGSAHQSFWIGNPFLLFPILLGRNAIPHVIVFMQIVKMVLAGLFFYLYLQKMKFSRIACFIPSLFYAFNGIMITRGFWINYGIECFYAALMLYAIEVYIKDKKWHLIPLSAFLLVTSFGFFYLYLYCILILVYVTFRYLNISNNFNFKQYSIFICKGAMLFFTGVLMSAAFLSPYIFNMFQSFRYDRTIERISVLDFIFNIFSFDGIPVYISEFYRFFSSDILGIFNHYSGFRNYLEGPLFYCGLAVLLLIPQFLFIVEGKKTRLLFGMGIIAALLYLIFPNVHLLLNAFIHDTFKLSSLWISIMMLTIFAYVISKISMGSPVHIRTLIVTFVFLLIFFIGLLYVAPDYRIRFEKYIVVLVIFFLTAYLFIFVSIDNANNKIKFSIFFYISILEVFLFSNITLDGVYKYAQEREKTTNMRDKNGYFDYSAESINFINSMDRNFFRIRKDNMFYLSESLFHGYYGSSHYDTFVRKSNIDFFYALNVITDAAISYYPYIRGLKDRPILETLTGFKYIIGNHDFVPPFGYKYFTTIGTQNIYKNLYSLPLGFTYDKYIHEGKFKTLDNLFKDLTLLNAVILNNTDNKLTEYIPPTNKNTDFTITRDDISFVDMIDIENDLPDYLIGTATNNDPMIIIPIDYYIGLGFVSVDIEFDITTPIDITVQLFWASDSVGFNEGKSFSKKIKANNKTTVKFNVFASTLRSIRIDPGTIPCTYKIENLRITINKIGDLYINAVNDRRKEPFVIDKFSQNHITGTVEAGGNRILFFSIPYDKGWTLKIDGKPVEIEQVNIGFIGAEIGEGLHSVELRYFTPGLFAGIILSLIGLTVFITMIVFRKRINFFGGINESIDSDTSI
jgi:uncharacterized membrane protein YfhO